MFSRTAHAHTHTNLHKSHKSVIFQFDILKAMLFSSERYED